MNFYYNLHDFCGFLAPDDTDIRQKIIILILDVIV